ncbi:MFS transporter [Roseibium denhamense]|uniref:Predicted arabinose efflux permease, MFS family n=1 Tax=Roseibium denhamense TaxID=76305 RepID=A0ABY1P423_9HYPH|nr:MFS transporter [Roseibium denhamense]MTI05175.1 MFS transporter [Roseibium denhamense]SMP25876.1 Predicted arabinose efflux permease, MFS family [Roseibium denhamense]
MAQTLLSVSALLLSVALLIFGHGLQTTLLPLAADRFYFSDFEIGAISSAYFVGMVLGCLGAPLLIMRAGHIRAFAALVSLMSGAAILHPVIIDPYAWMIIRIISGFSLAGFYMIVESWLNETATNENRGTVMSFYIVVLFSALMLGQVSVATMSISSFIPFAIASVTVSLAVMPVSLTTSTQPAPITLVRFRPAQLYRNSPAAFVGVLFIGAAQGSILTLTPLYGSQIGLTTNQAAIYTAAIIAGGLVAQWPIGRLSDKVDRRLVMIGLGLAAATASLGIITIEPTTFIPALISAFLLGTVTQPLYAVTVAHAFDHAPTEAFVETSSGMLLSFGIGSVIGPISASVLMEFFGPGGLYVLVIGTCLAMSAFVLTRVITREALTAEEKTDFEYASTAQVGSVISTEALDVENEEYVIPPEEFPAYEDDIYTFETTDEAGDGADNPVDDTEAPKASPEQTRG